MRISACGLINGRIIKEDYCGGVVDSYLSTMGVSLVII